MGTKAIDPQSIRNVTLLGDPAGTARLIRRLRHGSAEPGPGSAATVTWSANQVEHTIRLAELPSDTPIAGLERSIRVADSVIAVVNAAAHGTPRLETMLRVADDHQVARLCLITGLDHPDADFDRCVGAIAAVRGAVPLPLHMPLGLGAEFEGVVDLISMWGLESLAAEIYGNHWQVAEQCYQALVKTLIEQGSSDPNVFDSREITLGRLHHRIRYLTRIGDIVPVLCSAPPGSNDIAPLLDAIIRYLPSPLDSCQPEAALDY
ncbi:GTP-binding protein [Nocardia sp. NPDC127526]|uniref:GTP-binding protein n=1 Tax=Nocardia sp. NPDC127526 TaxID=3345393 RepID=UPI003635C136